MSKLWETQKSMMEHLVVEDMTSSRCDFKTHDAERFKDDTNFTNIISNIVYINSILCNEVRIIHEMI